VSDDAPPYMIDTTVFNALLRGDFSLAIFGQHRLIATGIQRDELSKTPDDAKRAQLLDRFDAVNSDLVLVGSFAFDIEGAGWDQACWNDGSGRFGRMRQRLQELDRKRKRRKDPLIQERDILIAETTIKAGAALVSGDCNLRRVVTEFGGQAIDPATL